MITRNVNKKTKRKWSKKRKRNNPRIRIRRSIKHYGGSDRDACMNKVK
jgi:hypothetical protein